MPWAAYSSICRWNSASSLAFWPKSQLDLKGGMNVMLEVQVEDVVKALAGDHSMKNRLETTKDGNES